MFRHERNNSHHNKKMSLLVLQPPLKYALRLPKGLVIWRRCLEEKEMRARWLVAVLSIACLQALISGERKMVWIGEITEDGKRVLWRKEDRHKVSLLIVDAARKKVIAKVAEETKRPRGGPGAVPDRYCDFPQVAPDGSKVVYVNQLRSRQPRQYEVVVVDVEKKQKKKVFTSKDYLSKPLFGPESATVAFTTNSTVCVYDCKKKKVTSKDISSSLKKDDMLMCACPFSKGEKVVLAAYRRLLLLDIRSGEVEQLDRVPAPMCIQECAVSHDGKLILYSSRHEHDDTPYRLKVYDLERKKVVVKKRIPTSETNPAELLGFSGDDKCAFYATWKGGKRVLKKIELKLKK